MTMFFRPNFLRQRASRRSARYALLGAMALVLAACSSYPLGMSKEEWVLLSPEQQLAARMKQADLNRANAERRAQQAAARRQKFAALEAAERRRIEELYRSSRYGDVLECVVEGGSADFRPGRHPYTPVPFTLARGEIKSVSLSTGDRRGKFWARYSPDGLSMKLCYRKPSGNSGRYCISVDGQSEDFSVGVSRRVSVQKVFRDANVVCAYRPEHNMPDTYIRRHDTYVYRTIHHHHYKKRARRTPAVIHNHYSRPAPRHATKTVVKKTVIHKHYDQAPAAQPPPQVVHKHYYERPSRGRNRGQATRPAQVDQPQTEAVEQAAPDSDVIIHREAKPRKTEKKPRDGWTSGKIRGHAKNAEDNLNEQVIEEDIQEEHLTSAPEPGKKRGRGNPAAD